MGVACVSGLMETLMRKMICNACLAALLGFAVNVSAELSDLPSGDYGLDRNHAYITFTFDHYGYSLPLVGFNSFDASLTLDSDNPDNSSVNVVIDAASIDSRVKGLDEMFKSDTFFDTENFPEITFKSTSFSRTGDSTFDVVGDLTVRDITNSVTLAATIRQAAIHPRRKIPAIGMVAEATISRSAWGMTYDSPGVLDEIYIQITAEFPQKTDD